MQFHDQPFGGDFNNYMCEHFAGEHVGLDKFVDMYRLSTVIMPPPGSQTYRFISLIPCVDYLVRNPRVT